MTRIKICGCMKIADAIAAAEAGADFVGIMFAPRSRRRVSPEEAALIVRALGTPLREIEQNEPPPLHPGRFPTASDWFTHGADALDRMLARKRPLVVGVFEDQPIEEVNEIADEVGLDLIQLSGDEPWSDCLLANRPVINAIRPTGDSSADEMRSTIEGNAAIAVMLDPSSGRGMGGDWSNAAVLAAEMPIWLAGGLTPENVAAAITQMRPWAVDVSSGVETSGAKDAAKIAAFVGAVRTVDRGRARGRAALRAARTKDARGYRGRRDVALAPSAVSDKARSGLVRPRLAEFDYLGRYAYHFELNTNHRAPVLKDSMAEAIVADLMRSAAATSFELLAYCVMPDHVHILGLGISADANAVSFMQRFKQLTGFRFAKTHSKPFWQQSFFDHAARLQEDLLPIARYILNNPVAAGLISAGTEWPWSGGTLLAINEDGAKAASLRPPNDGTDADSSKEER